MKPKNKISGHIIRSGAVAAFLLFALIGLSPAFTANQAHTLTFAERVAYQRAIEEIYWQHRIWPKENSKPKPALDAVMSQAQIEQKVQGYLRKSKALEDSWQKAITPDQLQAELERMATHTKRPEVLREVFAALGNDPFVIAECLVRPVLAERLKTNVFADEQQFQGGLKYSAESMATDSASGGAPGSANMM